MTARVTGLHSAVPTGRPQAELWESFFSGHYGDSPLAGKIFARSGIDTRHLVIDPLAEDIRGWGTGARMQRFVTEALPLGKEAVAGALTAAGLDASDVGLFSVVSCTGYATPGLDILLARDLGMSPQVQRVHVGHMGCYAAVPGLGVVADFAAARQRPAVLLCCELTSLHLQPPSDEVDQMVAHALFADAAVAVVVQPGAGAGWQVCDIAALTDSSTSDHMTWDVTDLGFRMGLSPRVPDVLALHVREWVDGLLAGHGLAVGDVRGWAVHPGGRRIVEVVGDRLGLSGEQLAPSYSVLADFGNCSSATVLLVLDRLEADTGDYAVAMAFGPGLTLYAALLRKG